MYSGGRRDLEAGAEVSGVVGIVVVVVSYSFSDLSRQPPLSLLTQLEQRETAVRDRQVEVTETRQSCLRLRPSETHRAGWFKAELRQRLWGKLEVCRQSRFPVAGAEGRLAVGCGRLRRTRHRWVTSPFSCLVLTADQINMKVHRRVSAVRLICSQ